MLHLDLEIKNQALFITISDLSLATNISTEVIRTCWIKDKEFAKILKPIQEGERGNIYIPLKNLRAFFKEYPAELERGIPNLIWLVDLLTR